MLHLNLLQPTRVPSMMSVKLLHLLLACDHYFGGVHYDHSISKIIPIGSVDRLVFSSDKHCYLGCHTSKRHASCIEEVPSLTFMVNCYIV